MPIPSPTPADPRLLQPRRRLTRLLSALLLWGPLTLCMGPAQALELGGATVFVRAPWKAELISYDTIVGSGPVEYYLTLQLDPAAGASLGRVRVQQIGGADRQFGFSPELSRAFLGRPRREGRALPVRASFESGERSLTLVLPQPVAPGETVTLVLRPWSNPAVADTYLFAVVIWPAGPDPQATPVGVARLRLYDRWNR